MLILTRRMGESLIIDDDIKIKVLSIKGRQVRIGIDAPKEVAVHREEIYKRIQEEQNQDLDQELEDSNQDLDQEFEDGNVAPAVVG